jgi:hypothetical protein
MTKKDFFILTIKLYGLLTLVASVFSVIPGTIAVALMDLDLVAVIWIILATVILVGLFVLLVFKADKVVQKLRLDNGFDDDRIELGNFKSADILKIGTFIVGGFLFIDTIPGFLSHVLDAFKSSNTGIDFGLNNRFDWVVSGVNLIIGYLLMTNYNVVANLMKKASQEE